ncbi:hypothetical protein A3A39_01765 [Candidatus Kaiserbacteria bacterium RIFCSPLOWO2_01_FULL_54_13]|uniref:Uncharacterized protein n=1 Tax=Candidatus Kaiserbacteria bacterium RIFCSPLOWO2_01_FULL_54_13 TaxID=1798512 RepID=A0A1F6F1E3_9BACT|nr:MAG: hypothetical protein A3A39_01765 [Candidatus Kaiserbacteria bacterium RIFCSPLOWO2_01_FULL_54_13]
MNTWIRDNWLKVVAILFVLGALAPIPYYAYYQLMNWIVVGAALMTAWQAYRQNSIGIVWVFALVAVVFNPVAPLYLHTDIWRIVDIVAAVLFMLSFFLIRPRVLVRPRI